MTPDSETESRLHSSVYERQKVGTVRNSSIHPSTRHISDYVHVQNLEHARTLLLRLEQDALNIKVQAKKQETQADLIRKREVLDRLAERLQEYNEVCFPSYHLPEIR
jgi:hypothetical protein